jgi:hypothetical protein
MIDGYRWINDTLQVYYKGRGVSDDAGCCGDDIH